jgi:hypothetical protein
MKRDLRRNVLSAVAVETDTPGSTRKSGYLPSGSKKNSYEIMAP